MKRKFKKEDYEQVTSDLTNSNAVFVLMVGETIGDEIDATIMIDCDDEYLGDMANILMTACLRNPPAAKMVLQVAAELHRIAMQNIGQA